jgi:flagellar motor component MotA
MYWIAVLVVLLLIGAAACLPFSSLEGLLILVDMPSLIMVVIPAVVMLLASFSLKDIGSAFSVAWNKSAADPKALKSGLVFFKAMSRYLMISAILVFFLGIVGLLSALSDMSALGRSVALSLLCIFYSILLQVVIAFPFIESIKKRLAELGEITK